MRTMQTDTESVAREVGRQSMPSGVRRALFAGVGLLLAGALYLVAVRGEALLLDLPQLTEDQPAHRPLIAAHAMPWPGEMAVFRSPSADGFELLTIFGSRARIGTLVSDFHAGPTLSLIHI